VVSQNEPIRTQKSGASLDEASVRSRAFLTISHIRSLENRTLRDRARPNAIVPRYNSAPLLKHRTLRAAWRKSLRGSTDIEQIEDRFASEVKSALAFQLISSCADLRRVAGGKNDQD
jgi:hypothetical protein